MLEHRPAPSPLGPVLTYLSTAASFIRVPVLVFLPLGVPSCLCTTTVSGYNVSRRMIYFDKVTKRYADTAALEDITLSIAPKEFVSIVGHSGAGKTTLLKLLLAEERPSVGNVFFESVDINDLPSSALHHYRRKIGMVFQDFRLLFFLENELLQLVHEPYS